MRSPFLKTAVQRLYHGSQKRFPIGFVLLPQADGYALSQDEDIANTERVLEAHRPEHCLPRGESVFLIDTPDAGLVDAAGGYSDFIYEAVPQGAVERNDMDWYSTLACSVWDDPDDPEAVRLAEGYWSGRQSPESSSSLWEYRARSAKIVALVEEN